MIKGSVLHPQGGADAVDVAEDVVAIVADGAETVDAGGAVRKAARRPQPPESIAMNTCACTIRCVFS